MVLLVEPLHGVTFALAWTAAIDFVKKPEVSGRTTRVMKLPFCGLQGRIFRSTRTIKVNVEAPSSETQIRFFLRLLHVSQIEIWAQ